MPHMTVEQMEQHGCSKCWYLQKATSWCLRYNCVVDNIARARKWREEQAQALAAGRGKPPSRSERMKAILEKRAAARQAEHEARLALYHEGYSDTEIAEQRGLTQATIRAWRVKHGMAPNKRLKPIERQTLSRCNPEEHARRLAICRECESDREAARRIGIGRTAYQKWRKNNGLPPAREIT